MNAMGNHYCIHLDETLGIFDMKVVFNVQSQLAYGASLVRPIKLEHPFNKQMTQENQQLNRSTNDQGFYKKTKLQWGRGCTAKAKQSDPKSTTSTHHLERGRKNQSHSDPHLIVRSSQMSSPLHPWKLVLCPFPH